MSVGTFDPGAANQDIDAEFVRELLQRFDGERIELDKAGELKFSILARHKGWSDACDQFETAELQALAKLFTVLEQNYSSFSAGADSPVIPIVRNLKSKGAWEKTDTQWIKSNTDNRFLPHGSLMDRL